MSALRETHKEYDDMLERWELCDALFGGEHEIHEKGEKYLPKLQDETDEAYRARLKLTPLFNAFYRTVSGLRGMMFRKPMEVVVPDATLPMLEDIDLAGTTLQGLAQDVVEDALTFGRVGLLVDYPQAPQGATKADAVALNLRPMIVKYAAKAIYNWRAERINGATVLSQVRLEEEEEVQDPEDEFRMKCEKRYRVLDLIAGKYRQRLYKIDGEAEILIDEVYPTMNGKQLDFIPFIIIGVDCIGIDVEAPPLIDLATTNLHHYMQATSYERGCFFSGLPTLFVSGQNDTNADGSPFTISIGGNLANLLTRPEARAYYVEVAGEFNALRQNLEDKKAEMAVLGARMLESQKAGVEAEGTLARRMSGEESLLSIMSQTVSMGITQAMRWFADWAAATGEVKVELTRDFMPAGMTSQDMVAQISAWQQGAISQQTLFENLKAGEIIASDVTFEEEQERIAGAMPGMTPPAADQMPIGATQDSFAPPADTEAIMQTMYEQHQAILNRLLQAIEVQRQPIPSAPDAPPNTDLIEMMQEMANQHTGSMTAIADAMGKEQPAPVINVGAPVVNVTPAAPPAVTVEAPVVNVAAPVINMPDQPITVNMPEQQPANVTVNNLPPEGKREITINKDANGKIIGATAE